MDAIDCFSSNTHYSDITMPSGLDALNPDNTIELLDAPPRRYSR